MRNSLYLIFIFLLFSCQKENLQTEKSQELGKNVQSSLISKDEMLQNQKLAPIIRNIQKLRKKIRSEKNQKTKKILDFEILTDKVAYIKYDGYHSYTFEIIRAKKIPGLENILISLKPDGSYETKRIFYDLTSEEIKKIKAGEEVNLEGKIYTYELKLTNSDLQGLFKSTLEDAINACPSGSCCQITWEESRATGWPIATANVIDCGSDGGGGGDTSQDSGSPGTGSMGTGGGYGSIKTENDMDYYSGAEGSNSGSNSSEPACFDNGDGSCMHFMTTPVVNLDCEISTMLNMNCASLLDFEQDYRALMSEEEKTIFDSLGRIKQLAYLGNAQLAIKHAEANFPDSEMYNGKGDAFRHAWWNAANAIDLGPDLSEQLATAHENKPSTYSYFYKEVQMDLHNNQVGRSIGFKLNITAAVMEKLNNGELKYLNNLLSSPDPRLNNRATSQSSLIPTNQ